MRVGAKALATHHREHWICILTCLIIQFHASNYIPEHESDITVVYKWTVASQEHSTVVISAAFISFFPAILLFDHYARCLWYVNQSVGECYQTLPSIYEITKLHPINLKYYLVGSRGVIPSFYKTYKRLGEEIWKEWLRWTIEEEKKCFPCLYSCRAERLLLLFGTIRANVRCSIHIHQKNCMNW